MTPEKTQCCNPEEQAARVKRWRKLIAAGMKPSPAAKRVGSCPRSLRRWEEELKS